MRLLSISKNRHDVCRPLYLYIFIFMQTNAAAFATAPICFAEYDLIFHLKITLS